jgi:hypothetical protein
VGTLAELNSLFTAWVEQVYHQRVHTETGMTPLARFLAAGPPVPTPAGLLTEAFRWGEWRTVTSTATVSLHGNLYQVDAALAGTGPQARAARPSRTSTLNSSAGTIWPSSTSWCAGSKLPNRPENQPASGSTEP